MRTGLGHFMRCFALGQYWRDLQRAVTFVGNYPPVLQKLLAGEGIGIATIEKSYPNEADLPATLDSIPLGARVVLDGYDFDYRYQQALATGRRLLVIDDFGHLSSYAGAALLNANLDAEGVAYTDAPALRLLGPRFALLRREFRKLRGGATARADTVGRVIVSLGGADLTNETLKVLQALSAASIRVGSVRAIVGPLNPHRAALQAFVMARPCITLVDGPADMATELAWADLAIVSAGSIFFEIAALGIPSVLLAVADNQLPVGRAAERLRASVYAGDARQTRESTLVSLLDSVLGDARRRESIAQNAVKLVDGKGVERVGEILAGELK